MMQVRPCRWLRLCIRSTLLPVVICLVLALATLGTSSAGDISTVSGASCTNVVVNGDLEQGVDSLAPWVSKGFAVVTDQRVHRGSFAFWMGGYRNADDALFQPVAIPEAETVTLRYWWSMHSLEDEAGVHDRLIVSLRTPSGDVLQNVASHDNTADRDTWAEGVVDLSAFGGMSVVLHMSCLGDAENVTSFFIDDVELAACDGTGTPTPTPTATPTMVVTDRCFLPLIHRAASG